MIRQCIFVVGLLLANAGMPGLCEGESCAADAKPESDVVLMIQNQKLHEVSASRLTQKHKFDPSRPECIATDTAGAAYRFGNHGPIMLANSSKARLEKNGYSFVKGFFVRGDNDLDYMSWWVGPAKKCYFTFQGSDSDEDFGNNYDSTPTTVYGVSGVHTGIANELTPLADQFMDSIDSIKEMCADQPITVVGHSLGGGLAQVFALALTSDKSTIKAKAGLTLGNLFTFGGMSCGQTNMANDAAADQCFPGHLYYTARHGVTGIEVDIVTSGKTGGQVLEPVRSDKSLVFALGEETLYECGHTIPKTFAGSGFDLHMIPTYQFNMGCITQEEHDQAFADMMAAMNGHHE